MLYANIDKNLYSIYFGPGFSYTPTGVEGAHDFSGNSANTDSIRQAKGEPGQPLVPTPTLETNKQTRTYQLGPQEGLARYVHLCCQEDLHWNQYLTTLISSCHKMFKILMDNQSRIGLAQFGFFRELALSKVR